jgi:hypothetical protein
LGAFAPFGQGGITVASVFVPGFRPSVNGLHFSNAWPSVPDWTIPLPVVGTISIGNASKGMCGGMTFTVRDLYQAHRPPPPDRTAPASGPVFTYVSRRLLDSWNIPGGVLRYLQLMNPLLSDHEAPFEPLGHGRAWIMIRQEWPGIKADLDRRTLSTVSLVTVKSINPADLGKNHQVLAYGYELNGTTLTMHLYDPNHADDDSITMSLDIGHPDEATPVRYSYGATVYCFFRSGYTPHDPSAIPRP